MQQAITDILPVGMVDEIGKAMSRLDNTLEGEVDKTYAEYQAETFKECKAVAKHAQDMMVKAGQAPDGMTDVSRELVITYSELVDSARGALATIESAEVCVCRFVCVCVCLCVYMYVCVCLLVHA